jgi:cyclic pyranopterin phosphate synthase
MRQGVVHFIRDLQSLRVLGLKRISIKYAKYAEP